MATEILNRKLRASSDELFSIFGRSNRIPATIIGAEHREIMETDHSGKVPNPLANKLEKELLKIGPLSSKGIDNYIGCCCEVRAANKIILKRNSVPILDINFTKAIRPRTGQIIRRCQNCRQVFG